MEPCFPVFDGMWTPAGRNGGRAVAVCGARASDLRHNRKQLQPFDSPRLPFCGGPGQLGLRPVGKLDDSF